MVYIRDIARDLYELKNRLKKLEQAYNEEPPGKRQDELGLELKRIHQQYARVKRILEGAKESS